MKSCASRNFIHVVIGIIKNTDDGVLVTKRRHGTHLGGLLEFPGGKVEAGELPLTALRRELREEVGININVQRCLPLIQIPYSYPDRNVYLDVYNVIDYTGPVTTDKSCQYDWKEISMLDHTQFPGANHGIIQALRLPKLIAVTADVGESLDQFLQCFEDVATNEDISIIQLRCHGLNHVQYMRLAKKCLKLCTQHRIRLVLNREARCVVELRAAGVHLTSKQLLATNKRPLNNDYLVSASCHNRDELLHASKLGLDYVFLGPVAEKHSGKNNDFLGWDGFYALVQESSVPVYAIGGLTVYDADVSAKYGGQGIAAIREFWPETCKK